ncbi:gem-associated protein 2-like [Ptychodera flava]|uniref:gem-associated protein 2-like n=1 Tax=Ptychodera flava TaxID=63121 RepID=UPI003969D988
MESPVLMDQVLEVASDSSDNGLAGAPTSGLEYLRRVRQEALQCEQVVVADIDVENFKNKQTVKVSAASGIEEAPEGLAASLEWQRYQTAFFSELREKLARHKARQKMTNPTSRSSLPKSSDEDGWCKLCFGNEFNNARCGQNSDGSTILETYQTEDVSAGVPPLISIIVSLNQVTVCQLLAFHIKWLSKMGFSTRQGRWLYALLLCLEKPVLADFISLLRALARHCASLRARLEKNDERLPELNLLICVVARYFDQTDLADRPSLER